jgi:valyl-tRNA synthetase
MAARLEKIYDPKTIESDIYELWMRSGAFDADPDRPGDPFCIVIPLPNVTDVLHLGHALNNTLQDILIRWRRMQGYNALWQPGTDHAGIATQTVVEKRILAEEGKRRTDFEREEFVARVEAWKEEYQSRILGQLKSMGCSCDWRRTRFTLDEVCGLAVRTTFYQLFVDGLIYRGKRLVNWDPATQTVLADDEVEHEEVHGHFWYLRYPLVEPVERYGEKIEHITVATTRPETMLGDTAVAMNPADPRAPMLVGTQVRLPIVGRIIPIIADEHVVLPDSDDEKAEFSTGFLKVTPGHDPDDYQIGLRHNLPIINVMAPDGSISDQYGWEDARGTDAEQFLGMDRFEAREAIVEWLRLEKLLEGVRDYIHQVGHSYRSHVPIEPYLSDQWYIAVKAQIPTLPDEGIIAGTDVPVNSLAGLALTPLLDDRLHFVPERYAKIYQAWLENLRDWPISRQLWWGHRIPIWSVEGEQTIDLPKEAIDCRTIAHEDGGMVTYACIAPGHKDIEDQLEADGWQRDPDVLDTWFSSALWPFSTMGWPVDTPDLKAFYPGDVLCTARDIITLWVSRMVMMGRYCAGDIPFSYVLVHAMLLDGEGRKMSKSLGNGIDPLVIIDSHGADSMRFTLCSMTTQTQDVRMPVVEMTLPDGRRANTSPKFDIGRNFCNKLWNASRFALMVIEDAPAWNGIDPQAHLVDRWILSRLNATVQKATAGLEAFHFNEYADSIYHFMWDDFCDWYLEIAKSRINTGDGAPKAVLAYVLDTLLRMLHPAIPFVTETLWQRLNDVLPARGPHGDAEPLLVRAAWPRYNETQIDGPSEEQFDLLRDLIRQVRNVRAEHHVPPGRNVDISVEADGAQGRLIEANVDLLQSQTSLGSVTLTPTLDDLPRDAAAVTAGGVNLYVLGVIDREAELARLTKRAEALRKTITGCERKLANQDFITKAPPEVVRRERRRVEELAADLAAVGASIEALQEGA